MQHYGIPKIFPSSSDYLPNHPYYRSPLPIDETPLQNFRQNLLRFGSRRVLLVSSPSISEQCFTKNDVIFANRPNWLYGKILGANYTHVAWASYGDHWRNLRRICSMEIFSSPRLNELHEEEGQQFHEIFTEPLLMASVSKLEDNLPMLRWFRVNGLEKRMIALQNRRSAFFQRLIEQLRNVNGVKVVNNRKKNTMIEVLFKLQETDPEYYTDELIRNLVVNLLQAGTDTTFSAMEWAFSLLLNLNETMRLYPSSPLLLPHQSSQDCVVEGYHIPRGTMLLLNQWAIHHNPDLWSEPEKFNPERFEKQERTRDHGFKFMPFGSGRRICPGDELAMRMIGLTLGLLIQCFDWERNGEEKIDIVGLCGSWTSLNTTRSMTTLSTNNSVLRGFFEKQKLTGPNFIDWYRQLRIVLSIEDKLNYLEQPIPPVPVAHVGQQVAPEILAAHSAWVKGSKEIAGLMLMTIEPEIQRNLKPLHAYEKLKEQEEGQSVSSYVLKMKGYIDNLEHLGGKTVNQLHAMLKLHEQTLPKSNAPTLNAIRAGKVQKGNKHKKSHSQTAAKGQNRGTGKNKQAYAPKPKIPPSPKRENPAKDSIYYECGEIGHWKRNCPQYLVELMKKKKNTTSGAGGSENSLIDQEESRSLEDLDTLQEEDTHTSLDTSLNHEEDNLEIDEPQTNIFPIPRLVAKGFTQTPGIDYEETFSPVADIRAIRILIAIAAYYDYEIWQMDVKTAFLNGYLNEEVYMEQPEGFVNLKYPNRRFCMESSKRRSIPMLEKLKLSKSQGASTPAEMKRMQNVPYASAVGSIMYAVRCTRLDVAFAQNITSRFQ
nr:isoflavone 2'-hydroxylase-like [Tanacetum cinerariifolium]